MLFNNAENVPDSACNTQSLLSLWHSRLGHLNKLVLHKVLSQMSINVPSHTPITFCKSCQYGKLHQVSFPSQPLHTTTPFQVVHIDVWDPAPLLSIEGYRYYVAFVDDFTRYTWIYPLRLKSEVVSVFEYFNTMVERQFTTQIKCLQLDWGGEYRKLQPLLHKFGIQFKNPCPHTHQQQGKFERKHCSIVETSLTLLAKASMDLKFWWEAFVSTTYLVNRLPTPVLNQSSPFEFLYHQKPDYKFLKVFGYACFPYLKPYNRHKLDFKTSKCLFLGYSPFHKGYRYLHPSGRIYIARRVSFDENSFPY